MTLADNKYEEHLAREATRAKTATREARLGAALVDAMLLFFLWFVGVTNGVAAVIKLNPFSLNTWSDSGIECVLYFANLAFLYALFFLINGMTLYMSGQSLGKLLLNIKIVRADGSSCPLSLLFFKRAFPTLLAISFLFLGGMVTVLALVFLVFDNLSIFSTSRRTLHDELADTIVIRA
jgi:uncharacterized RDD family membrane protein YckC